MHKSGYWSVQTLFETQISKMSKVSLVVLIDFQSVCSLAAMANCCYHDKV